MGRFLEPHPMLHSALESRLVWRYGNEGKSDMLRPEDARPEVVRDIRATLAKRVRDAGKTRLLEKTPRNALRLGFVDRVFSDCKSIHIMRNGIHSVLSIHRYWIKSAHGIKGVEPGRVPWKSDSKISRPSCSLMYWPLPNSMMTRRCGRSSIGTSIPLWPARANYRRRPKRSRPSCNGSSLPWRGWVTNEAPPDSPWPARGAGGRPGSRVPSGRGSPTQGPGSGPG